MHTWAKVRSPNAETRIWKMLSLCTVSFLMQFCSFIALKYIIECPLPDD